MLHSIQAFILVTIATSTGLIAGAQVTDFAFREGQADQEAAPGIFRAVISKISTDWAGDPASVDLAYGAVRGMTDILDPHSRFYTPGEYEIFSQDTDGEYFGIGIEIRMNPRGARVVHVIPGGPSAIADIRVDDVLIEMDGQALAGLSADDVTQLIRGPDGTAITLGFLREDVEREATVTRSRIVVPAVQFQLIQPGIGYAYIGEFQRRTSTELRAAIERMVVEGNTSLNGLVLDLRGNPGGLVEEAIAVSDMFLREGPILEVRGRNEEQTTTYNATDTDEEHDFALVVLVDHQSASSTEIVAGALQAHERAVLVGTRTFGKGSVQRIYEFTDGSALKLTTARYFLPDGRSIEQDDGLLPDHIVPRASTIPAAWARILRHLNRATVPPSDIAELEADIEHIETNHIPSHPETLSFDQDISDRIIGDAQLSRAVAILRENQ